MGNIEFTSEIRQSSSGDPGFLWEVSVIGEGPGLNSQLGDDGKLYKEYFTRESINGLTDKLEGVKVKAFRFQEGTRKEKRNHLPPNIDNAIGHKFTGNNVGVLEKPRNVDVNGKLHAFADMRLSEHDQARWLKDMLLWAHENGHPDYVGLSINSSGLTRQRIVEGTRERFMDIIQINRPKSVEVVDTPAAKGEVKAQFVRLIQSYMSNDDDAMSKENENTAEVQEESQVTEEKTDLIEESSEEKKEETPETSEEAATEEEIVEEPTEEEETPKEESEVREEESDDSISQNAIDTLVVESFRRHVYNPLTEYLDMKGVIYSGNTITNIVESLDFSGISRVDEAAIRALATYETSGKINAAKQLIEELSRVDTDNDKHVDESAQEDNSAEDDRIVLQEESNNTTIDGETMTTEDVKTTEVTEEVSEEVVEETPATEEAVVQESTPEEPKEETEEPKEEVKEKAIVEATPEPESNPDMLTKLTESLSKFTEEQSKKTALLEEQLTVIKEENEKLRKTEETRDEMVAALAEFRSIQEQERMDRVLRESGLYPEVIDEIREELDGKVVTTDSLEKIIDRKKRLLSRIQESSPGAKMGNIHGIGWSNLRMGESAPDKFQTAMNRLFEIKESEESADPALRFSTLRQGYAEITGDVNVEGIMNQRYIREGVIGHDTFEKTLSNTMNRYLVQWYDTFEQEWRRIIRIRQGVRDFKSQEMNRIGGFGNLKVFTDTQQNPSPTGYAEATPPVEQAGSFKPVIRAKMFTITEQMIKNDDLFVITRMLEESARAADETLMTFVFSLMIGGSHYLETSNAEFVPTAQINSDDIYSGADSRKLYGADNSGTATFDYWPLLNAINGMKRMRKIGNDKPLKLAGKKYLVLPYELENTALRIHPTNTDKEPGGQDNDANILPKDLEIIAIDRMYLGDDPNNWYLIEDPMRWEGIQVGFVDGEENPRIVLANNPTAGRTFSHGGLQYTVSHRYGGGIAGHEGMFASFVA